MHALIEAAVGSANDTVALERAGLHALSVLALPPMLAAMMGSCGAMIAQNARLSVHPKNLLKFSRLSPPENIKKLFSAVALTRVLKSILPASVLVWIGYIEITDGISSLLQIMGNLSTSASMIFQMLWNVMWRCTAVLLIWGAVDYALEWWRNERSLRMSKDELKQEVKESDGNPQIKAKIRRLQRQVRRRRMLQDVKRATLVVTNPTHFAIGIEFDPLRMPAPVVVAKGLDNLALQIKDLARQHEIPLIENRPLAHALYRSAQVGEMIPPKLYAAVAEVLAFIYRTEAELQARQQKTEGAKR